MCDSPCAVRLYCNLSLMFPYNNHGQNLITGKKIEWSWLDLEFSSHFIHKTNDILWIFNHWTWMKFNRGNETMNELYFVDGRWIYINDLSSMNLFHIRISWNFITRVMTECMKSYDWRSIHSSTRIHKWHCMHVH
jgi:hypothetical protein